MITLQKSTFLHSVDTKKALASFILASERLSMGPECARFESTFAQKQGRQFAVLVNSGSSANLILFQALRNLGRLAVGDAVGVSALTWATNIMPLLECGLRPVAVDCELDTLNVSPGTLKRAIEQTTLKALFLTNVLGFCDELEEIIQWCHERGILLLEDNCESLGSRMGNRLLGNAGVASTFSFFVGHHLSTIEGGMVCTDDEVLRDMLVMVRAHGWDRELSSDRQQELRVSHGIDDFFAKYTFYDLAYNVRPTEITGFLGNIQVQYWDELVTKRAQNFERFNASIQANNDCIPLRIEHMSLVSNFAMPVIGKTQELFVKYRDQFVSNQIEIRPIIAGDITRQPFYKKYVTPGRVCPNAGFLHQNGFYFANNPELTDEEVTFLCGQFFAQDI